MKRALLLALCCGAMYASIGAAPASANVCGGLVYYGSYYISDYRNSGIQIVDEINDAGFGLIRQYQQRWRDRKVYKVCSFDTGQRYHLHYRYYGQDTRSRLCFHWLYITSTYQCGQWGSPAWRPVSPGLVYQSWHWV